MKLKWLLLIIIFLSGFSLFAQNSSANTQANYFDMSEFPQWTRDLRRGEIVAFGTLPFTYFFTTFIYDSYRYIANDYNARYAPWPFKPADSIDMKQNELWAAFGIAAGVSITLALVDYFIVLNKRNTARQEAVIPRGEPEIIRRPLHEVIETADDFP